MTAEAVERRSREAPLARRARHEPGQSLGDDDRPRRRWRGSARPAGDLGLWFVSDEIYHGLTYAEPAATALAFDDDAVVINSFSKYYCMTGWRVGWIVVPRTPRAADRAAGAEPLHLAALPVAGGGARRLRRGATSSRR